MNASESVQHDRSCRPLSVEERVIDGTRWVALRARGAEWSWLTPSEAALLGQQWVERYGSARTAANSDS